MSKLKDFVGNKGKKRNSKPYAKREFNKDFDQFFNLLRKQRMEQKTK
tara:strand:- start:33 stop:173 length:141 start_codon:yes stop_codon:yes gene_type:complete